MAMYIFFLYLLDLAALLFLNLFSVLESRLGSLGISNFSRAKLEVFAQYSWTLLRYLFLFDNFFCYEELSGLFFFLIYGWDSSLLIFMSKFLMIWKYSLSYYFFMTTNVI